MKHTFLILLLLLTTLSVTPLLAQIKAAYPPPTPPLVAPVPDNAQWTLAIGSGKETPAPTAAPGDSQVQAPAKDVHEVHVTKTGKLKRDIISSGGGTVEVWYADGMFLAGDSNRRIMVVDYKSIDAQLGSALGDPLRSTGYTGLNWLDLKYYDQVVSYHGRTCYHYAIKTQVRTPFGDAPQTPVTVGAEAWIEVGTGLPVAYTAPDGQVYTYHFLAPPTSPLVLPPAFQAALADYEKWQDKMKRLQEAAAAQRRT
jgi:hypothetical protein